MINKALARIFGRVLVGVGKYRSAQTEMRAVAERLSMEAGFARDAAGQACAIDAPRLRAAAATMEDAALRVHAIVRSIQP